MVIAMPQHAAVLLDILEQDGFSAYLVGGCVRDAILGRQPHDWDICTSALPAQMQASFAAHGLRTLDTGLRHGTLTVLMEEGSLEVTTYRVEGAYSDTRHPDAVHFVDRIELDLARRDFTVNAIAYHPRRGLVDPYGAAPLLESGQAVICAVGDPTARFREDALRILRALRFAAVLGLSIEPHTAQALGTPALLERLAHISAERIRDELCALLVGEYVEAVLTGYPGVIGQILPEMLPTVGFEQRNPHHAYDVWTHTAKAIASAPPLLAVRLALVFHDLGKPSTFTADKDGVGHFYGHMRVSEVLARQAMLRLRFPNALIERVALLVRRHDDGIPCTPAAIRRRLCRYGEEALRQLLLVKRADNAAKSSGARDGRLQELACLTTELEAVLREEPVTGRGSLAVNGKDLLQLGVRGPAIGDMLRYLLEAVIDDPRCNSKGALLSIARRRMTKRKGNKQENT